MSEHKIQVTFDKNNRRWVCKDEGYCFHDDTDQNNAWAMARIRARRHDKTAIMRPHRADHDVCTYYP